MTRTLTALGVTLAVGGFVLGLLVAPIIDDALSPDEVAPPADESAPDLSWTDLVVCEMRLSTATQEATMWRNAQEGCDAQRKDVMTTAKECVETLSRMLNLNIPQGTEAIP